MTLQVTHAEWAPIEAVGSGVLFREGSGFYSDNPEPFGRVWEDRPPAEFVEAAQPCHKQPPSLALEACGEAPCEGCDPYCLDGRRRVAAVVPCCNNQRTCRDFSRPHCAWRTDGTADGFVTVGHVVVTWGPWLIVESWVGARANPHRVACLSHNGFLDWRWSSDDLSLVGQYAIGVEVVS